MRRLADGRTCSGASHRGVAAPAPTDVRSGSLRTARDRSWSLETAQDRSESRLKTGRAYTHRHVGHQNGPNDRSLTVAASCVTLSDEKRA